MIGVSIFATASYQSWIRASERSLLGFRASSSIVSKSWREVANAVRMASMMAALSPISSASMVRDPCSTAC